MIQLIAGFMGFHLVISKTKMAFKMWFLLTTWSISDFKYSSDAETCKEGKEIKRLLDCGV